MEILRYFARNPRAADTLEGIARWRLLDQVIRQKIEETHVALEWLVGRGFLLESSGAGTDPLFRLNPHRTTEAEHELAAYGSHGPIQQESEMPSITIDSMSSAAPWSALAPDDVTPSTELSLTIDTSRPRPNADPSSGRISGTANSFDHRLRRTLPATDLTGFDELRLWVMSDRAADGTAARPFVLEMRLASAAIGFSDPANTWRRSLPVTQPRTWQPVRLSLLDLPAGIRGAVTQMELRSIAPGVAFQFYVDDIVATLDRMIADVDAALLAQLNNVLSVSGTAVPAVLHPANGKLAQARPYFEIMNYDIMYSRERTESVRPRGDYSGNGYSVRPDGNAYELYYQVTAVADDRATQTQMLEFVLRTLPARGDLVVNNFGLPMESICVYAFDQLGGVRTDALPLFYRISTRQAAVGGDLASAVQSILLEGDIQSVA